MKIHQKNLSTHTKLVIFILIGISVCDAGSISFSTDRIKTQVNGSCEFYLVATGLTLNESVLPLTLDVVARHDDMLNISPKCIEVIGADTTGFNYTFVVFALSAGKTEIAANSSTSLAGLENVSIKVEVYKSATVESISSNLGWMYVISWGAFHLFQLYRNFKKQSGTNNDVLTSNLIGYAAYGVYNVGLYYSPSAQREFHRRHPRSPIPVMFNDVAFVIQGTILASLSGLQAYVYKDKQQALSTVGKWLLTMYGASFVAYLFLLLHDKAHFLDFLYMCSVINLIVAATKYASQVHMNYKRGFVEDWSISSVLLDFVGAVGSLSQLFLNANNYSDSEVIFENPGKFGLAVVVVGFNVIIILQRFISGSENVDDMESICTNCEEENREELINLRIRRRKSNCISEPAAFVMGVAGDPTQKRINDYLLEVLRVKGNRGMKFEIYVYELEGTDFADILSYK